MKKLIQINTVCNTSTGKLMGDIQRKANELGYETLSIVGRREVFQDIRCEKIGNGVSFWIHVIINTVFDRQGYGSYFLTKRIVSRLRKEKPDIIHLHNLHGYYINLPILFDFLSKEFKGKIVLTSRLSVVKSGRMAVTNVRKRLSIQSVYFWMHPEKIMRIRGKCSTV